MQVGAGRGRFDSGRARSRPPITGHNLEVEDTCSLLVSDVCRQYRVFPRPLTQLYKELVPILQTSMIVDHICLKLSFFSHCLCPTRVQTP